MTWKFWTLPRLLRNLKKENTQLKTDGGRLAARIAELETALACAKGIKAKLEKRVTNLNDELNGKLGWSPSRVTTLADTDIGNGKENSTRV